MRAGAVTEGGSARHGLLAMCVLATGACALDFDVGDRAFACPTEVTGCLTCNSDGTCRESAEAIRTPLTPPPLTADPFRATPLQSPLASAVLPQEPPSASQAPPARTPLGVPPDAALADTDAGASPAPAGDAASSPDPVDPGPCAEFQSRTSDSLCLNGDQRCFSLGSVLSPALSAWLDPTTLPREGSRVWCDRSGQRHHALLLPEASDAVIGADGRGVSAVLDRSLQLEDNWLSLRAGSQAALSSGNFAVLVAAAAPPAAEDGQDFDLFESGDTSRINLTLVPGTGKAEARITSQETALVQAPALTRSSVYDGSMHLFSLYRRSEVRVLDDVLQLRLNGVLEFRGSSVAIPRALDLASSAPPRIGGKTASGGAVLGSRGRVAAVVVLRGSVPEDELARLENFFCTELAACTAPALPPAPVPVAPALPRAGDAGP